MLKIREDFNLKELEKYGFMKWNKENAEIRYFKFVPINSIIIVILNDKTVDFQLPLNSFLKRENIKIESFIDDLIKSDIVVKE